MFDYYSIIHSLSQPNPIPILSSRRNSQLMAPILLESDRHVLYSGSDSEYGGDSDCDSVVPPSKRFKYTPPEYDNVPKARTRGRSNNYDVDVPKDEDDKALVKLKDNLTKVESLTDRDIFDMWRTAWKIAYISKKEQEARFLIFQKAIVDRPPTQKESYHNIPFLADRTERQFYRYFGPRFNNFIFKPKIDEYWVKVAERNRQEEKPTSDLDSDSD